MDPHGRNLGFLDRSRYFFFQIAPQLYSQGWADPIPDPLFLRRSGSARKRTRTSDHYSAEAVMETFTHSSFYQFIRQLSGYSDVSLSYNSNNLHRINIFIKIISTKYPFVISAWRSKLDVSTSFQWWRCHNSCHSSDSYITTSFSNALSFLSKLHGGHPVFACVWPEINVNSRAMLLNRRAAAQ
jgi:hypothetical protein